MADSYNKIYARKALSLCATPPKRILVMGCGGGADVKALNELLSGDVEIHGVDIIANIGAEYQALNVLYIQTDGQSLPLKSAYYDLVYSFAVFEHIIDMKNTWQNMIDVLRENGLLFTLASPLWASPFGHHKGNIFKNYPYVHLYYPEPDRLKDFCKEENIISNDSTDIRYHIDYMLNVRFFNKHLSDVYIQMVAQLKNIDIVSNNLNLLDESTINGHESLLGQFSKQDLLSLSHELIAFRK